MRLRTRTGSRTAAMLGVMVAGLLAMPSTSMAAPPPAPQPVQDSAIGSGTSGFCGGVVEVDARSGPSGENPTGQFTCGTFFNGPVTCLSVRGNVALLTTQTSQFGAVAVRITDAGPSFDQIEAFPGIGCPAPLGSYLNIGFAGNVTVVDAPPGPTNKDQCKNGGWAQFGFRNQGQCVAFVARGPKP